MVVEYRFDTGLKRAGSIRFDARFLSFFFFFSNSAALRFFSVPFFRAKSREREREKIIKEIEGGSKEEWKKIISRFHKFRSLRTLFFLERRKISQAIEFIEIKVTRVYRSSIR